MTAEREAVPPAFPAGSARSPRAEASEDARRTLPFTGNSHGRHRGFAGLCIPYGSPPAIRGRRSAGDSIYPVVSSGWQVGASSVIPNSIRSRWPVVSLKLQGRFARGGLSTVVV